jgi:5-hydroxyisourate hydrolase-like protein (transthyretin family)
MVRRMGRLSTHVIDLVQGGPAQDIAIDLQVLEPDGSWRTLKQVRTNADGRTDAPLLAGADFTTGTYMPCIRVRRAAGRASPSSMPANEASRHEACLNPTRWRRVTWAG